MPSVRARVRTHTYPCSLVYFVYAVQITLATFCSYCPSVQALIPGFTAPSVVVANVTATLLQTIPQALGIPTFVIPDSMLNTVNVLLTNLTGVPTIIQDVTSPVSG